MPVSKPALPSVPATAGRRALLSGALPPDCVPGSADGLRTLRWRWNGTLDFRISAKRTTIQPITGRVKVAVYEGTGPADECDGWTSQLACRVTSRAAHCP